jgi:hypothetical protein
MQSTIRKNIQNQISDTMSEQPDAKRARITQSTKKFWLPDAFDDKTFDVTVGWDYLNNKVPMLGDKRTSVTTPFVSVVFADLGPSGDIGKFGKTEHDAKFNICLEEKLSERLTERMPHEQKRASEFFKWLRAKTDEMLEAGWEDKDAWKKWKLTAEKKAKKKDETRTAKDIFKSDASLSMFKTFDTDGEDVDMLTFSTKYQKRFGGVMTVNRPTVWMKRHGEIVDVTDELSSKNGFYRNTPVRCMVELIAYNTDTKYGIRAELGRNMLVAYLENRNQSTQMADKMADIPEYDADLNVVMPEFPDV